MRVVMSGCFDLFHKGHQNLIKSALGWTKIKENNLESILTIFINSDESIKKLKGENRPIHPVKTRMNNINDYILSLYNVNPKLNEEISHNIIEFNTEELLLFGYDCICPDLIIHGNDIEDPTKITGAKQYNVLLVPKKLDISTTKLIKERNA